jgi:broad specificity phosphatase PhoE
MSQTQIILIRHAETLWNVEKKIQGHIDSPLSETGRAQAAKLAPRLAAGGLAAAYSSDSGRCVETARAALQGLAVTVQTSADLREQHFGRWEGMSWPELKASKVEGAADFLKNPSEFIAPGGESWNQMQARVFKKIAAVAAENEGKTAAVFTHGGPCRAAIFAALGLPGRLWRQWIIANASIQILIFQKNADGNSVWKLARYNDTAHLDPGAAFADPSA